MDNTTWKTIALRLKSAVRGYKDAHHVTEVDLAAEIGIERAIFNHWLNGRRIPKVTDFISICRLIKVDPAEIIHPSTSHSEVDPFIFTLALRISSLPAERRQFIEKSIADQETLSKIEDTSKEKIKAPHPTHKKTAA